MRISLFGFNVTRHDWKSTARVQESANAIRLNYWRSMHSQLTTENNALREEKTFLLATLRRVRKELMDLNGTPEYTDMVDGNRLYYKVESQEVNA